MTGNELRTAFLEFFAERGHTIKPSYPLVPPNDPTLLFTSAGMVQFKSEFLGEVDLSFSRAVTSQKCFRTTDIENVGRTARHHTFFEMLGNFSFGDYFKEESCRWGWEFLTETLGIPVDRLYVTIYKDDDETGEIWKRIGVAPDRISKHDEDNFWTMGPTGPCGPCSEIFYDYGPEASCGRPDCAVGCECDRYVEVWNHVFTQFDRQEDGSLVDLPQRNIDTGMGLDRLASVMQGKTSNFETDLMFPVIERAVELAGVHYKDNVTAYRVLADHARALPFVMADGVLPSNEGRGYVARRLLRRAVKYGRDLGLTDPFLATLAETVIDIYGDHYPELRTQQEQISRLLTSEEEGFQRTLSTGLHMLTELLERTDGNELSGDDAFRLYDTYGFPLDLTMDVAAEHGKTVDESGFETAMEAQRERAREADDRYDTHEGRRVYLDLLKELGETRFLGYDTLEADGTVVAIVVDGERADHTPQQGEAELFFDQTPCYAEAGGQVADEGTIERDGEPVAGIVTVTKPAEGLVAHRVRLQGQSIAVGDTLHIAVPDSVRQATAIHHSATHLLHAVLRKVLGDHVSQAGSYVGPDRLRFDYNHFEAPTTEQLATIERIVNERIRTAVPVSTRIMAIDDAKAAGAMALFGEKYGEQVRVVSMGDHSTELCGGTHLTNVGEIGMLHILADSSIAAGTRRIEAVAGHVATNLAIQERTTLQEAAGLLNVSDDQVIARLQQLLADRKQLEKQLAEQSRKQAAAGAGDLLDRVQDVDGIPLLAAVVDGVDAGGLRTLSDTLRQKLDDGVVVLGSATEDKVALLCAVAKSRTNEVKAGDLIKPLAQICGGGGGGKPELAQAGGKRPEKLPEAIAAAPDALRQLLGTAAA